MTKSIRFRLTVWYAVILTMGFALFGGSIWWSLRHRLLEEFDEDLNDRASRFEMYFRARESGRNLHAAVICVRSWKEFCQGLPAQSYIKLRWSYGVLFSCLACIRSAAGAPPFRG